MFNYVQPPSSILHLFRYYPSIHLKHILSKLKSSSSLVSRSSIISQLQSALALLSNGHDDIGRPCLRSFLCDRNSKIHLFDILGEFVHAIISRKGDF